MNSVWWEMPVEPNVVSISLSIDELEVGARRSATIARLSKLPRFHPAAAKLLALSADSHVSPEDFDRAFRSDPAIASDLLAMANSPLYGLRSRIKYVRHAIALLGLDEVRSLALTLAMGDYALSGPGRGLVQSVWSHSLATAMIAEAIALAEFQPGPPLYTAGLLHDIGRLGLLKIEGEQYLRIMQREYYEVGESLQAESLLFGCSHDDAGALLTRAWGLPDSISDCVRLHHETSVKKGWTLHAVLRRVAHAPGASPDVV